MTSVSEWFHLFVVSFVFCFRKFFLGQSKHEKHNGNSRSAVHWASWKRPGKTRLLRSEHRSFRTTRSLPMLHWKKRVRSEILLNSWDSQPKSHWRSSRCTCISDIWLIWYHIPAPNGLDIFTYLDLPIFQPAADRNVKVLWIVVVGDGKKCCNCFSCNCSFMWNPMAFSMVSRQMGWYIGWHGWHVELQMVF